MRRASLAVLSLFLLAACADEPAGPGADLQETEGSPTAGESISGWVRQLPLMWAMARRTMS